MVDDEFVRWDGDGGEGRMGGGEGGGGGLWVDDCDVEDVGVGGGMGNGTASVGLTRKLGQQCLPGLYPFSFFFFFAHNWYSAHSRRDCIILVFSYITTHAFACPSGETPLSEFRYLY